VLFLGEIFEKIGKKKEAGEILDWVC